MMLVLAMSLNVVNVEADALDYLGDTIDGSVLTNDLESSGDYQSVARSTYLHQGFVRITEMVMLELLLERNVMLHATL